MSDEPVCCDDCGEPTPDEGPLLLCECGGIVCPACTDLSGPDPLCFGCTDKRVEGAAT